MSASSTQYLYLPGESGRELWQNSEPLGWTKCADDKAVQKNACLGIEARAFDSSPFFAFAAQGESSQMESTAALRWESLGHDSAPVGKNFITWEVGKRGDRLLVATFALCQEVLTDEVLFAEAAGFEPSARLLPIPANHFAIWQELGQLVFAMNQDGRLVHVCNLSSHSLNDDGILEVHQMLETLRTLGIVALLEGGCVWLAGADQAATDLQKHLDIPVTATAKPAPRLPESPSELLPPVVAEARMENQRKRRRFILLGAAISLLALFFAGWTSLLGWKQHQIQQRAARVSIHQPALDNIRQAQMRWTASEEAISPDRYPVEVFHQLVSLLPPEGIRFKEFNMDLEKVVISGEATSLIHASKFQADIQANEALKRYTFSAPQPTVQADNRATFRIEGKLTYAGGGDAIP